ncbi:hypothetical protein DFQ28_009258 [Apophysomyces sp. BC1034]|nr:hypothetical protein DFQ29_007556 [Apophysomyces sp. BC1021]KAG0185489.1 hypothetical protein DFQ28_009258 [Apophysomyces sp. BC1034]
MTSYTYSSQDEASLLSWSLEASIMDVNQDQKQQQQQHHQYCFGLAHPARPTFAMNEIHSTMALQDSPVMNTPFLDAGMDTPHSNAAMFTPYFSPYSTTASPFLESVLTYPSANVNNATATGGDVYVSNYLGNENDDLHLHRSPMVDCATPLWSATMVDPVATFNGDPSQLLIDKSKTAPPAQLQTAASSDSLFPPLGSQELEDKYEFGSQCMETHDAIFDFPGFDFTDAVASPSEDAGQQTQDQQCEDGDAGQSQPCEDEDEQDVDENEKEDDYSSSSQSLSEDEDVKPFYRKRAAACHVESGRRKRRSSPEERRYECHICHRKFSRRYNLSTHIRTHNKDRKKDHPCGSCPKAFDRKHDLARHIATVHHGERSYPCDRCQSTFSRKDALTRHNVQKHMTFDGA